MVAEVDFVVARLVERKRSDSVWIFKKRSTAGDGTSEPCIQAGFIVCCSLLVSWPKYLLEDVKLRVSCRLQYSESLAEAIHHRSERRSHIYITACSALNSSIIRGEGNKDQECFVFVQRAWRDEDLIYRQFNTADEKRIATATSAQYCTVEYVHERDLTP